MNRAKGYLLVLLGAAAYLSVLLVLPFAQYVLAALLLAYVCYPVQRRLESYVPSIIAAFVMVGVAVVAIVLPFVLLTLVVAGDAIALFEQISTDAPALDELETLLAEETGIDVDLAATAADAGQDVASILFERTTEAIGAFTQILVGIGLALFVLYYLLKNGDDLYGWLRSVTPLPPDVQDDVYGELDEVMWAVLAGHVLIAVAQGLVAGIGLAVTGIPNAAFWTFVMVILALIPLVGAFLVWGPAVVYLFLVGEPAFALGLFLYSAIVVGVTDDYLRPIVVDRYAELNPAVIIVGVLGGIYAFGVMGIFFGPVVLGAFVAIVSVLDEHWESLE